MFRLRTISLAVLMFLAGGVALVIETRFLEKDIENVLSAQLTAARALAEHAFAQMSETNVDAAVALANSQEIRVALETLAQTKGGDRKEAYDKAGAALGAASGAWLEVMKKAERPDWVLVVDGEGMVALRSNAPADRGDSLAGIPLVLAMLGGAALDGVWAIDEGVYAVAAAATLSANTVVGGVVVGYKLTTERIKTVTSAIPAFAGNTQVGVALLWSGSSLGQNFQLEAGEQIPVAVEATEFGKGDLNWGPLPVFIGALGRYMALARSTPGWPEKLQLVVAVPHAGAYGDLAQQQLFIILFSLLIGLVSLGWGLQMSAAVTKPLSVIVEHLSGVQRGTSVELLPEVALKEPYVRLGKLINLLVTSRVTSARPTGGRNENIDDMLSPPVKGGYQPPQSTGEFKFDGIPGLNDPKPTPEAQAKPVRAPTPPPAAPSAPPFSLFNEAPAAAPSSAPQSGIASLFDDTPAAAVAHSAPQRSSATADPDFFSSPPAAAASSAADPYASSRPPADDEDSFSSSPAPAARPVSRSAPSAAWNPERTVMVQVPEELLAASSSQAAPQAATSARPAFNPDATVVAMVPQDLLSATGGGGAEVDPDDAHFREVYQQFIATRRECGEGTDDLTYERFLVKLRKNREQLVSKYGCRTVRFQVYVKAGKAALKAVPVRD